MKQEHHTVEFYEKKIHGDINWFKAVEEKSKARNIPLDSMIKLDTIWTYEQEKNKK